MGVSTIRVSLKMSKDLKLLKDILKGFLLILSIFTHSGLGASLKQINPSPIHVIKNPNTSPSFVNSVDFHPRKNLFCVTFTHNNNIVIYKLNKADKIHVFQVLKNPSSQLSCPQHAVYSKDGRSLVVVNWCNQTFNVYHTDPKGFFQPAPITVIPFSSNLFDYRPHGIALSPDGKYLAVAYGASRQHPRAVALYLVNGLETAQPDFQLLSLLQDEEITKGIPKGIAFSPDGSCLLVTLADTKSVAVYTIDWPHESIIPIPRQILRGPSTLLSRPEDIKFTAKGNYCAVSNSDKDTLTFYKFDKKNNYFVHDAPSYTIENPEAQLCFPHGLAFSSDGKYLVVTQFGPVVFDQDSNLSSWGNERKDSVAVFKLQ